MAASTCVALRYISLNGMYFSWEHCGLAPRLKLCHLLKPHLYTPALMPLSVLDLSIYQTRPPLLSGLSPFCHSHLAGNLTVNGLWYAYLSIILSDLFYKMGSCSISWDFLVWSILVGLGLHDSETLITENFPSICHSVYLNFTSGCERNVMFLNCE